MVDVVGLDDVDRGFLHDVVRRHQEETGSVVAEALLVDWPSAVERFAKVMPRDFRRVLDAQARAEADGTDPIEAIMAAARA